MSAPTLTLREQPSGREHRVGVRRLVVAGFTGRDPDAVRAHVDELAELGVPVPAATPVFIELEPGLLTTGSVITVSGTFTSGEVEPVLVATDEGLLLTVGSDHTDRDVEMEDLARSKAACPKVVATACLRLDDVDDLDDVVVTSWTDDTGAVYQWGELRSLLPPDVLMERLAVSGRALAPGDVMFLGTVPVDGGRLRASGAFHAAMRLPDGSELSLSYAVEVAADVTRPGAGPMAEPE